MPELVLKGCRPEPLGSYLKALAVFRIVSQQVDGEARGWWDRDEFHLASRLDEQELIDFLLLEYRPTPILAPWNGGSGFYPKDNHEGVNALCKGGHPRFDAYRESIIRVKDFPEMVAETNDEDERRTAILRACRNGLPDEVVDWLDAAIAVTADGSRAFPPLLGTGGNDGRLEYTNTFMRCLADLLVNPKDLRSSEGLLRNAISGLPVDRLISGSVGQYDPGRAGGFNQGQGIEEEGVPSNPWNFILTMEGAILWASGLYRRQGVRSKSFLCSPFTVRASAVGYSSSASTDQGEATRAEIWAPLWKRPATFREVQALFREGRASVGTRPAENGISFAEAACSLGVQRGITGFVRYQLLKRRGKSYLALPGGRVGVAEEQRPGVDLLEELHPLLERIDQFIRMTFREGVPAALGTARRVVDERIFQFLLHGAQQEQSYFRQLVAAVGRLESALALRTGTTVHVASRLSAGWVVLCGDQIEVRIAAALASIGTPRLEDQIRGNLLADAEDGRFAWRGRDLAARLSSVLQKRLLDADRAGPLAEGDPFRASVLLHAEESVALIEGGLDERLLEDLLFAFTLVDWRKAAIRYERSTTSHPIPAPFALLKHLFLSEAILKREDLPLLRAEGAIVSLLLAGRIEDAAYRCRSKLRGRSLPVIKSVFPDEMNGERLAAALLIPTRFSKWWSSQAIDWKELDSAREVQG